MNGKYRQKKYSNRKKQLKDKDIKMQGRKSCRNETKQRRSRKLYKEVKKKPKLKTLYYIKRLKSINRS